MYQKSDFYYDLPASLIAQFPKEQRSQSRLLHVATDDDAFNEYPFHDLSALLRSDDLLILNDTRVVKSRLFGHKASGGRVEVFVEQILTENEALCMVRASRSPAKDSIIILESGIEVCVIQKQGAFLQLRFDTETSLESILEQQGSLPLPPYIERASESIDEQRYQTVFAQTPGAVAAPTAGLHFDDALLEKLQKQGVQHAFITLHVGAGTFKPIRSDDIRAHQMHAERLQVNEAVCDAIRRTRAAGGRVIGVGSTAVRALESASVDGVVQPFSGTTQKYMTPGYQFQVVDAMITNFHLPESTLMVLVCAFGGYDRMMAAYRFAIEQQFRFFSYGDAMFIEKNETGS